jgi:hypothetical protein
MGFHRTLGELLLAEGLVTPEKLASALAREKMGGSPLGVCVVEEGAPEERVAGLIAHEYGYTCVNPLEKKIRPEHLALIPQDLVRRFALVPLFLEKADGRRTLFVAMADPTCVEAIEWVELHAGARVRPVVARLSFIRKAIARLYGEPPARLAASFQDQARRADGTPQAVDPQGQSDFPVLDPPPPAPRGERASTRHILHAVTELLLEKEVLSKDELMERVKRITSRGDGTGRELDEEP